MCFKSITNKTNTLQADSASVDVIPLFLESVPDLPLDEKDLVISFLSCEDEKRTLPAVHIQHAPTGLTFQSTGTSICFEQLSRLDFYYLISIFLRVTLI